MGNTRVYCIGDVYARFKTMRGFNVMHPMGFDSFGLPAENAAMSHGADPGPWTEANIELIRSQITSMGFTYDWRREVACHRPNYYRWTQWLFKLLFDRGLAYQKGSGELLSELQDGPGERADRGRNLRAMQRSGRAEKVDTMVFQNH